jgi:DNA-directed RNA polymerase subunit RPC12/RpoP
MSEQQTVTIVCSNCKGEYPSEGGSRREDRGNGLYELGYRCPHCNHWTHGCFLTPRS